MARDSNYMAQSVIRTNMALDLMLSKQDKKILELAMLEPTIINKYRYGELKLHP